MRPQVKIESSWRRSGPLNDRHDKRIFLAAAKTLLIKNQSSKFAFFPANVQDFVEELFRISFEPSIFVQVSSWVFVKFFVFARRISRIFSLKDCFVLDGSMLFNTNDVGCF